MPIHPLLNPDMSEGSRKVGVQLTARVCFRVAEQRLVVEEHFCVPFIFIIGGKQPLQTSKTSRHRNQLLALTSRSTASPHMKRQKSRLNCSLELRALVHVFLNEYPEPGPKAPTPKVSECEAQAVTRSNVRGLEPHRILDHQQPFRTRSKRSNGRKHPIRTAKSNNPSNHRSLYLEDIYTDRKH